MNTTTLFPPGAVAVSVFSFLYPEALLPFRGCIVPLLGLVMPGMGMTLLPDDFRNAIRSPKPVTPGVALSSVRHNISGSILAAWWGREAVARDQGLTPGP